MMRAYSGTGHLNVGCGEDIAIVDLARLVAAVVGFSGEIVTDPSRPDGAPRKLLDVSRLAELGWRARIALSEGIAATYRWYLDRR
jgi:nucleoside-diphosphate-sugar epimerase